MIDDWSLQVSQQEISFINDLETWFKSVVPGIKDEAAHSYAHVLVVKLDITYIKMLRYTLEDKAEAGEIDFIKSSFHLNKIMLHEVISLAITHNAVLMEMTSHKGNPSNVNVN